MNNIVCDLISSSKSQGVNIIINDITLTSEIVSKVTKKYCSKSVSTNNYIWECIKDEISIRDGNAWKWIPEFLSNCVCIMFFNLFDEKTSVAFVNGKDIELILEDMYGFEFYLTNEATEYLLCYNHHDYLIACGTAKEWLANIIRL